MTRRNMLQILVALLGKLSLANVARAASSYDETNQVELGIWTFILPSHWALDKKRLPDAPYFESSDGSKGCYVKSLSFSPPPHRTAPQIAAHIQRVHRQAFEDDPKSKWRVMREESSSKGETAHSILDLFDKANSYRVLSKVLARGERAVQLTLHDYSCEDYAASVRFFSSIAESLRAR